MLSPVTRTKKQDWMTDDILVLMERRRVLKRRSTEYNDLNKEIRRECHQAKESFYEKQCEELRVVREK